IKGAGKVTTPSKIKLQGLETKKINILIKSKIDGIIRLTINIDEKKIKKLLPVKVGLSFSKNDLFHDDFKNGMKNWTVNEGQWRASNGIASVSGLSHFAFIKNNNWQDYTFEVKTRCRGSDDSTVDWLKSYIFFRLQDEKNFYRFGIHGGCQTISLYKCVNGKWFELAKTPFSAQRERWYALKVAVKGNRIIGYLNGEVVIEATDDTFSSGGIGLGVLEDWMVTDYASIIVKKS
ncbi:DUF1080 domain-containing protein, partial [candidate division WOR-3 bacterium]|nr:DUF1080 domain-containing protein [candidate division WOR-3 bacterium]